MKSWICILLMFAGACHSASIAISSNEIVSMPIDLISLTSDLKKRESDVKKPLVDVKPQALTSARSEPKPAMQLECETDDNCPPNQYCYETNVCAACYDCSVYFRFPSKSGCAKTPQMCGSCENGYQNEILSNGKVRDRCARIPTFQPETVSEVTNWNTPHFWVFAAFVVTGLLVTIGVIAVWCCRNGTKWAQEVFCREGRKSCRMYTLPSAPPLPTKDCDISRHCVEEPLVSNYKRQQIMPTKAAAFDTSEIPSKFRTGENTGEGTHAQFYAEGSGYQYNAAVGPNPPELEDESTTPSTWTPQTMSEGTLVTSFAGLFSQGNNGTASTNNNIIIPHNNLSHNYSPNLSFNDTESSNTSTGSGGPHTPSSSNSSSSSTNSSSSSANSSSFSSSSNVRGPVNVLVQGGFGPTSSVQCSVMVNNIQINEY